MFSPKPAGRGAAARKYDILTALGAYALSKDKHEQRRVLRLMTLITARYNWARDDLSVGQREIARLWSVDERTVKRDMAVLRARGWLVVRRQGARGRVTQYGLGLATLLEDTTPVWSCVGPDYEMRMGDGAGTDAQVVPLNAQTSTAPAPDPADTTEWGLARTVLHAEDPALHASWFAALTRIERAGGRLTLRAPSRFHAAYVQTHLVARVLSACRDVDPEVHEIRIVD